MTDSFPRQQARTQNFTLGAPRSFRVAPDGSAVTFLRSASGGDPATGLWVLDVASGQERLVADPAGLAAGEDDEREKARRERARERARGITAYAADAALAVAAFAVAGRVYLADIRAGTVRELAVAAPAADPRPDPAGRRVAYASAGALRVIDLATGEDRVLAAPDGPGVTFGLAEFIAAEEMGRTRGYWWAPDGTALLAARVDEEPVQRWHIADPARPADLPREIRYPAAGTPNASVSALILGLDGGVTEVSWDQAGLPYLAAAAWAPGPDPLLAVQSRDQRDLRLLRADPATGQTALLRADTDPAWTDLVAGAPAWAGPDLIAWTADAGGARRLLLAAPDELAAAVPVTPDGLQVREILAAGGGTVLLAASDGDPTQVGLWLAGPDEPEGVGRVRQLPLGEGVHRGTRGGGTTVTESRRPGRRGREVTARTDGGRSAVIGSRAQAPALPDRDPVLLAAGPRGIRTAIVLPSWHEPGTPLPVLCDPYGGPHAQRVLAARDAYLVPQWLAEQGFAVVIADGRGTPGRGPEWERAVAGDLAGPVLADQVEALHAAAERCPDLDLSRVGIRGWSFGGYLAALAVLDRPDVFHAAVAGAPVTDWELYDTHYTERYLGLPRPDPAAYRRSSLLDRAAGLRRPLMIIHGLADDNVVVAHSLRLSSALLAAGRPHAVLPLTGVTHMASREEVAENLLLLQVEFLRTSLGVASP
jgi:dipeptidyl-peptidase 4